MKLRGIARDSIHSERVGVHRLPPRPGAPPDDARRTLSRRCRSRARRRYTPRSGCRRSRRSCGRTRARSRRRGPARCRRISSGSRTCAAWSTATRPGRTAAPRWRWRAPPRRSGWSTSPSPITRPPRRTRGLDEDRLRRQWDEIARAGEGERAAPARHRVGHPRGRRARLLRPRARAARRRRRERPLAHEDGRGRDDPAARALHVATGVQDLGPRARAAPARSAAVRLPRRGGSTRSRRRVAQSR